MKNYFLPMLLSLFFLGACDKNDEIIPEDADENFITSVVMTVDGKSYTADITDNTVTTVSYTHLIRHIRNVTGSIYFRNREPVCP